MTAWKCPPPSLPLCPACCALKSTISSAETLSCDLINFSIVAYGEQEVKFTNDSVTKELLFFLKT